MCRFMLETFHVAGDGTDGHSRVHAVGILWRAHVVSNCGGCAGSGEQNINAKIIIGETFLVSFLLL